VRRGGANDARVQTSLGIVCLITGDVTGAAMALGAARPLFANRPPTAAWYHYMGLVAALQGDTARALQVLNEGVEAHPRSAALLNNLAAVFERRGMLDDARGTAERGVLEDATLAQLHKNLGDLQYRTGRYDEALESFLRATKAAPDLGADVYLKLGNIRLKRHEREDAVRCWERALELDPENEIVRTNLESVKQVF